MSGFNFDISMQGINFVTLKENAGAMAIRNAAEGTLKQWKEQELPERFKPGNTSSGRIVLSASRSEAYEERKRRKTGYATALRFTGRLAAEAKRTAKIRVGGRDGRVRMTISYGVPEGGYLDFIRIRRANPATIARLERAQSRGTQLVNWGGKMVPVADAISQARESSKKVDLGAELRQFNKPDRDFWNEEFRMLYVGNLLNNVKLQRKAKKIT